MSYISQRRAFTRLILCFLVCLAMAPAMAAPNSLNGAIQSYKAGRYRQALSQFQTIAQSNPSNATVHYYMALCYQALNQVAQARRQYQWVASYSRDPRLKSMAAAGLRNMQKYQSTRTYSGHGGVQHSQQTAYGGRGLKKVIEFYTDW